MKKLLTIIALILTSATYAYELPVMVSRHLTIINTEEGRFQIKGLYHPDTNRLEIHNRLKGEELVYVLAHERGHWYEFQVMTRLQRRIWNRALKREQYMPTKYCRETPVHQNEECWAETLAQAVVYNRFPPENTSEYRIIKKASDKFKLIFNK